ncbi:SAM-dependent methyltransferase [Sediminibacillus dalangtanensis]|uniref:tRNA 5-hydroxyuridine methyltransferase n=1 Tax=Sediminibacillus dalangtanensis TaxID=2729421 RepID=A0ABX7VVV4_9BACI|nr:O-methyltransferase [Sediminibacillus dalangtanensis]QTM99910.1 SAM-dependent methyltransferase [Sediminibacillus dalangtanensis]
MDDQLEQYLTRTVPAVPKWAAELEAYAQEHRIPIMEPLGIHFLMQLIRIHKPAKILEIGTAIGYSALRMLEAYPAAQILTIERDEQRYQEAINNIKAQDKQNQIQVILGDALEVAGQVNNYGLYDMLFIDAAKGQYQRFFETYTKQLNQDAVIVSDNVLFRGLVAAESDRKDRLNKLAGKVRSYNEWLVHHPDFYTTIIPVGDGIAVSVRR